MTRIFAASFAIFALALGACERHPLPGQTEVTHTHGSNGAHQEGEATHSSETAAGAAKHEEKKAETPHAAPGAHEEAPKFFPEKK